MIKIRRKHLDPEALLVPADVLLRQEPEEEEERKTRAMALKVTMVPK